VLQSKMSIELAADIIADLRIENGTLLPLVARGRSRPARSRPDGRLRPCALSGSLLPLVAPARAELPWPCALRLLFGLPAVHI